MIIEFGKHKGKDISEVPLNYIKWAKDTISDDEIKKVFIQEYNKRTNPEPNRKYDPIIFGKNQTEDIVNITADGETIHIFYKDGTHEEIDHKPWVLSSFKSSNGSERLKGNQHYKYITPCNIDRYELVQQNRPRGVWFPRSIEEGFMLKTGYTCFKGMKLEDVSILSFDIEATSLDPNDPNAEVILISNTFRDRNGQITKKLFDIFDYPNQHKMIQAWSRFVNEMNPDLLIGHNILGYDLPYLNVQEDLEIGRDSTYIKFNEKPSKFRKDGSQQYEYYDARIYGRTVIDTLFLSIKYDIGRDFPSYGLKAIEKHLNLVGDDRIDWDFKKYPTKDFRNWPEEIYEKFKKYCADDGDSPLAMIDIMLPPFFYLCQSVPKTLQQMINEASGSQLDSLMIRSYLQDGKSQPKTSSKADYEGAISMGVPGIYENVRKVDVASLYPSIMLQYDIYDKEKDPEKNMLYMLKYFRDERLVNKKLAKDTGDKYYDDMQGAQKIMINSMYGFLGAGFLLYNFPFGAAEVTRHGREILLKGVEWATGHTLKKVIKQIRNKGKANEEIRYEWVVGDKVPNSSGNNFQLVNVDTDSFSITNGLRPTDTEFNEQIKSLNEIYPELIVWEDDGIFDKVIVVKAKNYVLQTGEKIKYKGSSITDQKKEPVLRELLEGFINTLLVYDAEKDKHHIDHQLQSFYKDYCKKALNPENINDWCVKKTVTSAVINANRLNEQKVLDACNEAIKKGVIGNIQEGDKIWLYQAIDGEIQKVAKGKPVFLKSGKPSMVENKILKFPELYSDDMDKWHYVKRCYDTISILENVINIEDFEKYHLKSKRNLLE